MSVQMDEGEKNDILTYVKRYPDKTLQEVAVHFARNPETISRLLKQYRPTTELARASILARANQLVEKVVDKADVDQLIDILSRPNIGVLAPAASASGGGKGPNIGVLVSVQQGSLAAITEAVPQGAIEGEVADAPVDEGRHKRIAVGKTPVGQLYGG